MSTRGQTGPDPISRQTSTRSERTKQLLTEHREPETFETDTDTETKPEEPEPEEPKFEETEQDQLGDELAEELERLQMAESKGKDSKGKQPTEQALTTPVPKNQSQCTTYWRPRNIQRKEG
jgi:hypothetical protein